MVNQSAPSRTLYDSASTYLQSLEGRVALGLLLVITVFSRNFGIFSPAPPVYEHLGAEYYNIAQALVEGRGYSDPFGEITGPTAWQPPLYTLLLAGILWILEQKSLVAEVIVALTNLSLTFVGLVLFRLASRWRVCLSPWAVVAAYVVWLWVFYNWFFMMTHDIWLFTLLVALIANALSRYVETGHLHVWTWGLLGGAASLTSPSILFAWGGISVLIWIRTPERRRTMLRAMAIAVCILAPWVVRNAVVLGTFVPSKSNAAYEAYSANYEDEDGNGIYDGRFERHPYNSPITRFHYGQLGEVAFMRDNGAAFVQALKDDPGRYLANIAKRALAITVWYPASAHHYDSPGKRIVQRAVYVLPLLGLLISLRLRGPGQRLVRLFASFCAFYFLPYVLIAFYSRYLLPVSSMLIMFSFLGADQLANAYARRRDGLLSTGAKTG
jgi:hypothetical protein